MYVGLSTNKQKRRFWEEMAKALGLEDSRWEDVRKRWSNACVTYRRRRDLAGPRNSGRGAVKPWQHFEIMDQILRDNPVAEPSYVIATNDPGDYKPAIEDAERKPLQASENTRLTPQASTQLKTFATPTSKRSLSISGDENSPPGANRDGGPPRKKKSPFIIQRKTSAAAPANKRPEMSYEQYLHQKHELDIQKARHDATRTNAIVSLVECFKAAAEKEKVSPHQKLVELTREFMATANSMQLRKGNLTTEETIQLFRDIMVGLHNA